MKLIEMEQDGTGMMLPVGPTFVNPTCVAYVRQACESDHDRPRTYISFSSGPGLTVVGESKDIGRQIQEALSGKDADPHICPSCGKRGLAPGLRRHGCTNCGMIPVKGGRAREGGMREFISGETIVEAERLGLR